MNVDNLFNKMSIQDRSEILDKIHKIRMKVFDDRGFEDVAKPHYPHLNALEKDKIVEQYFAAKK